MFLHKPLRIAALGFVFAIALMLYRILQYVLRNRLRETDETIAGHHGRPTQKPTVAFVQRLFSGVIRITMETPTGVQSWMQGFTEVLRRILTLFGLPTDLNERVDLVG
jgi:transposase